jgi:carboxymethylenebutenolidase
MATEVLLPLPKGGTIPAALALPDGRGPHPGVVVIHEVFGLTDDIRRFADRFAAEGYAAVAPDLFSHGRRLACIGRVMREMAAGARGAAYADLEAARTWLADREDVDGQRLGVAGFCMGGGFALLFAAPAPAGVCAVSVNYGRVPKDRDRLRGICPTVASYGGRDLTLRAHPFRLKAHLSALGVEHDIKTYRDSGHSFMSREADDHRFIRLLALPAHVGYRELDAEDSWRRILGFFDKHLAMST